MNSKEEYAGVISKHEDHYVSTMGAIPPGLVDLASEAPGCFDGYSEMRRWIFRDDADADLPLKYRHLIGAILDCSNGNLEGATNHARAAMRRGLTIGEFRDAAVLLIIACGTPAWGQMGRKVLAELRSDAQGEQTGVDEGSAL